MTYLHSINEVFKAEKSDCKNIAKLHVRCLDRSFLGTLGENFLTLLYRSLLGWDGGIILVAREGTDIKGFIAGAADSGKFFKYFLRRNFFIAGILILPRLFRKSVVIKVLEVFKHNKDQDYGTMELPRAELLCIAVEEDLRGRGVSALLFEGLVKRFKDKRVKEFKIVVGSELEGAVKFYTKMGCKKKTGIEVHKGQSSEVMVFDSRVK
jgi:ribosomal protein S18 acetylase RimI-like enzyme